MTPATLPIIQQFRGVHKLRLILLLVCFLFRQKGSGWGLLWAPINDFNYLQLCIKNTRNHCSERCFFLFLELLVHVVVVAIFWLLFFCYLSARHRKNRNKNKNIYAALRFLLRSAFYVPARSPFRRHWLLKGENTHTHAHTHNNKKDQQNKQKIIWKLAGKHSRRRICRPRPLTDFR